MSNEKSALVNEQEALFEKYSKELKNLPGVIAKFDKNEDESFWSFQSPAPNSLKVTLYLRERGGSFVDLQVEGVDCGFWHTAEHEHLDFHIELAKAALLGKVLHRRSPVLRLKEVCFQVGNSWMCTREEKGLHLWHYITQRNIKTKI